MEKFDIDSFIPDYESTAFKKGSRRKQLRMYHEGMGMMLRVDVDKALDWRRLEKRTHEIKVATQKLRHEFHDFVDGLGRKIHGDEEKWVMIDDSTIVTFRGAHYSYENAKKVIERATVSGGRNIPKFVLIGIEEGGGEVGRLLRLMNTYDKAFFMYEEVLKHALRDRFMAYLRKEGIVKTRDKVFLLRNEGRCIVVTVGFGGRVNFIDGDVVEC